MIGFILKALDCTRILALARQVALKAVGQAEQFNQLQLYQDLGLGQSGGRAIADSALPEGSPRSPFIDQMSRPNPVTPAVQPP